MNIAQVRLLNTIFAMIIIASGLYVFLWYISAMHVSLEILNRQRIYLQHRYKSYNSIFWAYSLVLLERLRISQFSESTEWMINCAEHLFFGIVICIKVYIYTAVFSKAGKTTRLKRAAFTFISFNVIGLLNEIFQNSVSSRSLFVFIPDSIKDIQMNLLGAAVFMIAVCYRVSWLKNKRLFQSH